ncbi:hypothetical protein KSD_00930 [Ktedonobacter sp. SOSP1-85]|nr:hypothetical protein KSD_00930 [Ktedonobacter sp. SOSP1-85]
MCLVHSKASMGLVPYARRVEAMEKRSSSVAICAELCYVKEDSPRRARLSPSGEPFSLGWRVIEASLLLGE